MKNVTTKLNSKIWIFHAVTFLLASTKQARFDSVKAACSLPPSRDHVMVLHDNVMPDQTPHRADPLSGLTPTGWPPHTADPPSGPTPRWADAPSHSVLARGGSIHNDDRYMTLYRRPHFVALGLKTELNIGIFNCDKESLKKIGQKNKKNSKMVLFCYCYCLPQTSILFVSADWWSVTVLFLTEDIKVVSWESFKSQKRKQAKENWTHAMNFHYISMQTDWSVSIHPSQIKNIPTHAFWIWREPSCTVNPSRVAQSRHCTQFSY